MLPRMRCFESQDCWTPTDHHEPQDIDHILECSNSACLAFFHPRVVRNLESLKRHKSMSKYCPVPWSWLGSDSRKRSPPYLRHRLKHHQLLSPLVQFLHFPILRSTRQICCFGLEEWHFPVRFGSISSIQPTVWRRQPQGLIPSNHWLRNWTIELNWQHFPYLSTWIEVGHNTRPEVFRLAHSERSPLQASLLWHFLCLRKYFSAEMMCVSLLAAQFVPPFVKELLSTTKPYPRWLHQYVNNTLQEDYLPRHL